MRVPLRWLEDYVDIGLPPHELARALTFAGLEVEALHFIGPPTPGERSDIEAKVDGLAWDPELVVVASLLEVTEHPDADRLVIAHVFDGREKLAVVTGAPNLFAFAGRGPLDPSPKVAFARTGARLYDGHKPDRTVIKVKPAKIRGVESVAMICSEKELGISDAHEGVILLDDDAPDAGTPLVDYMGDVVLDISLTPNLARDACMLGVAREVSALTGAALREPDLDVRMEGEPVEEAVRIEIREPELNPRFSLALIEAVEVGPSPYWLQLRLRLAGVRPISNVVDITNYVMLEIGQPLHAFDYDVLRERAKMAGSAVPTIITRLPDPGERLTTLDDVDRALDDFTILVADEAGPLSLGGVMGGLDSGVSERTTRVLLEAAAWMPTNIRRTVKEQKLESSEAGYRFSRGVHPAQAIRGNRRAAELLRRLAGGRVREGILDDYPAPPDPVVVDLPLSEIVRLLGMEIPKDDVLRILRDLDFDVDDRGEIVRTTAPDTRLDIESGVADLVEEIARIFGYERIPETQLDDALPPQRGDPDLEAEERIRNMLVELGLQEVITYRLTSAASEERVWLGPSPVDAGRVVIANPIAEHRDVLRHSVLASVLEVAESNARFRDDMALFEIGQTYLARPDRELPEEPRRLAIVLTGPREPLSWTSADSGAAFDFFDLKGVIEGLLGGIGLDSVTFETATHPTFHPGRAAVLRLEDAELGWMGEVHPVVCGRYDLEAHPVLAADLDAERLIAAARGPSSVAEHSRFPPVVQDIAVVVDHAVPASTVERELRRAGGGELAGVQLFDVYEGPQIPSDKRSLAYRLTYQSPTATLTDEEAGEIRGRIVRRLEKELGATLRE